MSGHPYEITAPVSMTVGPGAAGTFQVINSGTKPLVVHESLGRFTTAAVRYPAADHATPVTMSGPWLTVWPASFTLAPGQAETVHISSQVPAGARGDHFLSVVWAARPVHVAPGAVHATGAVATSVRIPLPGTAVPVTSRGVAAAPRAAGHGGPVALTLGGIMLAVLAVIVMAVALQRRYRRARQAG